MVSFSTIEKGGPGAVVLRIDSRIDFIDITSMISTMSGIDRKTHQRESFPVGAEHCSEIDLLCGEVIFVPHDVAYFVDGLALAHV